MKYTHAGKELERARPRCCTSKGAAWRDAAFGEQGLKPLSSQPSSATCSSLCLSSRHCPCTSVPGIPSPLPHLPPPPPGEEPALSLGPCKQSLGVIPGTPRAGEDRGGSLCPRKHQTLNCASRAAAAAQPGQGRVWDRAQVTGHTWSRALLQAKSPAGTLLQNDAFGRAVGC